MTTLAHATTTTSARCFPTRCHAWPQVCVLARSLLQCQCHDLSSPVAALPSFTPAARHSLQVLPVNNHNNKTLFFTHPAGVPSIPYPLPCHHRRSRFMEWARWPLLYMTIVMIIILLLLLLIASCAAVAPLSSPPPPPTQVPSFLANGDYKVHVELSDTTRLLPAPSRLLPPHLVFCPHTQSNCNLMLSLLTHTAKLLAWK